MVAAQLFNQQSDDEAQTIYGVVTSGEVWRFLKLEGQIVFVDALNYYVNQIEKILGILVSSLNL